MPGKERIKELEEALNEIHETTIQNLHSVIRRLNQESKAKDKVITLIDFELIPRLRQENRELREVVEAYANKNNWEDYGVCTIGFELAQQALSKLEGKEPTK